MSAGQGQEKAKSSTVQSIVKSPFDELRESLVVQDIVDLCIKSITGKQLKDEDFRSRSNDEVPLVLANSNHIADTEEKSKYADTVISESWCPITLKSRVIKKKFVSYYYEQQDEKSYYLDEPYLDSPLKCRTPEKCTTTSCDNCIPLPCKGYDSKVERMVRTILTTQSNTQSTKGVTLTPISILIPTSLPKTEKGVKSTTNWEHLIIDKDIDFDTLNASEKLSLTHRILLVFQALRLTSLKYGPSVDQTFFSNVMTKHKVLKETLSLNKSASSYEIQFNPKFVNQLKDKTEEKSEKKQSTKKEKANKVDPFVLGNFFGKHDVNFNNLKVVPWRENDKLAMARDIDVLSTGLASLMTYCSATVITIYVESEKGEEHPSSHIIAPKNIINMFLDLRDHSLKYEEYYNLQKNSLIRIAQLKMEKDKGKVDSVLKKSVDIRNKRHAEREGHGIYIDLPNYRSLTATDKKKVDFICSLLAETDITYGQIMDKVNRAFPKDIIKISDMRSSLGFRVCSIDQDHFDPETFNFKSDFADNPEIYLRVNFPIVFRYDPD